VRRYPREAEDKVRLQQLVREWTRAGLLDATQGEQFAQELQVDLRRTGNILRAGLALFTALVIGASVGLLVVLFEINRDAGMGWTCALAAAGCYVAADRLVVTLRFYRHGVEEMLAVASCVLVSIAAMSLVPDLFHPSRGSMETIAGLVAGAVSALLVFRAFGFLYAAIGSLACVALIPFYLPLSDPFARMLSASVLACAFVMAHAAFRRSVDAAAEEADGLQAAAFGGMYLALNVYATHTVGFSGGPETVAAWFKWMTYAAIWLLPAAGLWLGLESKARWLLDVSIVAAIGTLASNKPYLGLLQRPWDPMLLGVLLIGIALVVRRWLAQGPDGERAGFTSQQVLASDQDMLRLAAMASAAVDVRPTLSPNHPQPSGFEGGRSGGGGGGATF